MLSGGSAKAAINIPALKSAVIEPVKDYMLLAENIGALVKQLSNGNLKNINITVNGNLSELNVAPLEVAVLKGIFSSFIEGVNFVNAPLIAKQRGLNVVTSKSQKDCTFIGSISVTLTTDVEENTVTGALIAKNMPRIVRINDYNMSIEAEEHMLMVPHENKPSMVAKVAVVIGEHNININRMQVAQKSNKSDNVSIMIITTDSDVDDATMETINKIDGIKNAQYIKLNA